MLQKLTAVKVADTTGVVDAMVIQVFPGSCTYAHLSDKIRVSTKSIKKLRRTYKVAAGRMRKIIFKKKRRNAIIVRVKNPIFYRDGSVVRFMNNAVVLTARAKFFKRKRYTGIGTRMLGYAKLLHKFLFYI